VLVADCKSDGNPDGDNTGFPDVGLFWIFAAAAAAPGAVFCWAFPILGAVVAPAVVAPAVVAPAVVAAATSPAPLLIPSVSVQSGAEPGAFPLTTLTDAAPGAVSVRGAATTFCAPGVTDGTTGAGVTLDVADTAGAALEEDTVCVVGVAAAAFAQDLPAAFAQGLAPAFVVAARLTPGLFATALFIGLASVL
jgi:hypothetical protein